MNPTPPSSLVVLLGGDLNARVRIERAARARGLEVVTSTVGELPGVLSRARLVIVDLDSVGREVLDALSATRDAARVDVPAIGYFSHVDAALGAAAAAAGVEALPRGRFWRELDAVVARARD